MKVDAYLEQKNYNHLLVIAFLFLLRSFGALYQKCYIKMLTDCNLVPENTQHLLARGLKPSRGGQCH